MTSSDGTVGDARRAATAFAARERPEADLGALALVVSELVANASRHAGGALPCAGTVRLSLWTSMTGVPPYRPPAGRGRRARRPRAEHRP
ncbi:ATP-binding protein [Streptomyces sp. NPDC085944]|uniref:ATP-binding protein n=1 Tax=Streptomyces sp. NPDC085944 TaxID=3154962 RepID=UPI00342F96B0